MTDDAATIALTPHRIGLVARLLAEEHLLLAWSEDTQHPRLAAAYRALHTRVTARCAAVRAVLAPDPETRRALLDATLAAHEEGLRVRFELSRLKLLRAARRDRLTHDGLPGHAPQRDAEAEEVGLLEDLIAGLARGVC